MLDHSDSHHLQCSGYNTLGVTVCYRRVYIESVEQYVGDVVQHCKEVQVRLDRGMDRVGVGTVFNSSSRRRSNLE